MFLEVIVWRSTIRVASSAARFRRGLKAIAIVIIVNDMTRSARVRRVFFPLALTGGHSLRPRLPNCTPVLRPYVPVAVSSDDELRDVDSAKVILLNF